MEKKKKKTVSMPLVLYIVAATLLLFSTVGSTRAALTYSSENYEMQIEVPSIGVSLVENGVVVGSRDYVGNQWTESGGELLTNMLGENEKIVLGKSYPEALSVHNSGTIDSYVRVVLYKSWTKDGEAVADTELSPDLIALNLTGDGWIEDEDASTPERRVLYYTSVLPSGGDTAPLCDILRLDPALADKVTETRTADGSRLKTEYAYDGYRFNIRVEVDAVQTHNAVEAIRSAWGVDVEMVENQLSLVRGGTGSTRGEGSDE